MVYFLTDITVIFPPRLYSYNEFVVLVFCILAWQPELTNWDQTRRPLVVSLGHYRHLVTFQVTTLKRDVSARPSRFGGLTIIEMEDAS